MKLLLLQTDIRWLAPGENRRRAGEMIDAALPGGSEAVDLVVLPEMFTTGFAVEPAGVAEADAGAETLAWMRSVAARLNAAVAGSVAVEENGRYFNRLFFVKPDGEVARYDKRHLFSFAGEDKRYTAGAKRVVVEWRGWRILLQVCYDLRFPVFARNRGDYDMVIYTANWPTVRIHPWNTLLRARAIENVCYAAGVNRTGEDPFAAYSGGTALAPNSEGAVLCEVDMDALKAFRAKFPALDDADDFIITN